MTTTAMSRTSPEYRGHLADGYFLSGGRLQYRPPADPQGARRRIIELIGEPEAPLVAGFAIDGRLPTCQQVAAIEHELHKAPSRVVQDFRARGGKIEVIAGVNAKLHPVTASKRNMNSCGGWYCHPWTLICVAAEADPLVLLHEIAHHFDRSDCGPGRFSSLPLWRQISEPGRWEPRFQSCWEKFAESFALHFHSDATRDRLGDSIQDFIERACE